MLIERRARISDRAWLWDLYQDLLKKPITQQWGWDIEFQKKGFNTNLSYDKFKIISIDDEDVAAYILNEEPDHLYLKMLLVARPHQGKGIGRRIISTLIAISKARSLPIRLSVIKANPVDGFYLRQGFVETSEADGSTKFEFAP